MTFEEAVALTEAINRHAGWSAEIEATGEVDAGEDVYVVSARCERFGLAYNADIEAAHQWPDHFQRMDAWVTKKEKRLYGN